MQFTALIDRIKTEQAEVARQALMNSPVDATKLVRAAGVYQGLELALQKMNEILQDERRQDREEQ